MAELAVRDGYLSPADLPRGDCIMTTLLDADGTQTGIRIDHADPRIIISAELLDAIADNPLPHSWLNVARCSTYDGAVLRIEAVNRTVVYRITEYIPAVRGYIAEWPD
jgi:hypothetical protein